MRRTSGQCTPKRVELGPTQVSVPSEAKAGEPTHFGVRIGAEPAQISVLWRFDGPSSFSLRGPAVTVIFGTPGHYTVTPNLETGTGEIPLGLYQVNVRGTAVPIVPTTVTIGATAATSSGQSPATTKVEEDSAARAPGPQASLSQERLAPPAEVWTGPGLHDGVDEPGWQVVDLGLDAVIIDVAAGDFDRDGIADLIGIARGERHLRIFKGSGNGRFAQLGKLDLPFVPDRVLVGNFAGCTRPDIIVVSWTARRALLYVSSGAFAFGPPVATGVPAGANDVWTDQLNDHPGLELVWTVRERPLVWSFSTAGQVIEWKTTPNLWSSGPVPSQPFLHTDLTGDGVAETVYYSHNPGEIFLIEPNGYHVEIARNSEAPPLIRLTAADVDGDGRVELLALDRNGRLHLIQWRKP